MQEKFREIVESAKDAIIIMEDGVITYINSYGATTLGYQKDEIIGKNFVEFISDEDKEKAQENYRRTTEGKKTFLYEVLVKKKNGTSLPVEISAQKIQEKDGDFEVAFIRDISARKKAEKVFYLQEERFHAVTENIPDIIARYDSDSRYVYINAAGEKAFGLSKKDVFWKTDKDLGFYNERSEAFEDAIASVFKTKEGKTFYSEGSFSGQKRYYYTILVPEFFEDGEVNSVLSITRDITEIREIDEVKSEFISITSHQLRSPLSVINWCALSLLRGEVGEMELEQIDHLEKIHESTRKLIKITDVFLNTTMIDLEMFVFNPKEIDAVDLIEEVLRESRETIERERIHFTRNYPRNISVKFDPRVLKIIFRGMVSNAIEYTPKEGSVDFSLERRENILYLEIGDSGCGVPEEDQEKIFTKFYRAEPARNMKAYGTGLDLYLIKAILAKVNGEVRIESPNPKYGRGTVFYIKIPIVSNEE